MRSPSASRRFSLLLAAAGCHAHACVGMKLGAKNMPTQAWAWHPAGLDSIAKNVSRGLLSLILLVAAALTGVPAVAAEEPPQKVREVLVPFKDLNVLLENQPRRVLLSRQEYDDLVRKAKVAPVKHAPIPVVVAAADYAGVCDSQRVRLTGQLTIDVLDEGLQAVPVDLAWVGLLEAKLDGRDAPLGATRPGGFVFSSKGSGGTS